MPLPGSRSAFSVSDLMNMLASAAGHSPAMQAAGEAATAPLRQLGQDARDSYQIGLSRLASPPAGVSGFGAASLADLLRSAGIARDLGGAALSPLYGIGAGLRQSLTDNFDPPPGVTAGPAAYKGRRP